MRIRDLTPGDVVTGTEEQAVYIGRIDPHPLHPSLSLVIWWLDRTSDYSFDALSAAMELPADQSVTSHDREGQIRRVLHAGGPRRAY